MAGIASTPRKHEASSPTRQRIITWSNIYWLCWLRLKLLLRGYTRDWRHLLGAILLLLFTVPLLGGMALGTFAGYVFLPRQGAIELLLLVLVGLYLLWALLPLVEFSVNEGLDVTKLTLYPLTRVERMVSLLLATLLDIPTLGIVGLFAAILLGWSRPFPVLLVALPALLVAYVHIMGLSQLVLAAFMGLLRSRRYRDLTIIVFALFGSACSIGQQVIARNITRFDSSAFAAIHLAQYLRFTPPGMAGWAIVRVSEGAWVQALGWLAASIALTIPLLWGWMALLERGLAMAESGTIQGRRPRQRSQASLSIQQARTAGTAGQVDAILRAPASTQRIKAMLPSPVHAIFMKELRYFWRDPQTKASMLSSFVVLIVLFLGPLFGSRSGGSAIHPWTVLASCLAPLFMTMNFSMNIFGLERLALTTLFLFPVRPQYIFWGKNLAVASIAFGEQVLVAAAFAFMSDGWGYYLPAIMVGVAAIAVMLGCGNIVSVLVPFRVSQFKLGTSASGSPESGCLRSLLGLVSLGVTVVVLTPVIAGVVAPLILDTPGVLAITLPLALLYGLVFHQGATRFIAPRLERRIPEILAQTTRE